MTHPARIRTPAGRSTKHTQRPRLQAAHSPEHPNLHASGEKRQYTRTHAERRFAIYVAATDGQDHATLVLT